MPERIQMSRQRPWRAEHPEAVVVDRRSRWGNPWRVVRVKTMYGHGWSVRRGPGEEHEVGLFTYRSAAFENAVSRFRDAVVAGWGFVPWPAEIRAELAGKDLACWCYPTEPCHADVLLEIANGSAPC